MAVETIAGTSAAERGRPTSLHQSFRGVEGRVIAVRDDDLQTVAAYSPAWAEQLAWGPDEFVNWPVMEIGFLPDYVEGDPADSVRISRERLNKFADTQSTWQRIVEDRHGQEHQLTAMASRWTDRRGQRYWTISLLGDRRTPDEVLDKARAMAAARALLGSPVASGVDTTETRRRLAVRIDSSVADLLAGLARREGVTVNGLVQSLIEGVVRDDQIDRPALDDSDMGYALALAMVGAERGIARARAIDYDRRTARPNQST